MTNELMTNDQSGEATLDCTRLATSNAIECEAKRLDNLSNKPVAAMNRPIDGTKWADPEFSRFPRAVWSCAAVGMLGGDLYRAYWQRAALRRLAKYQARVLYYGEFRGSPWLRRALGKRVFQKAAVVFLNGQNVNHRSILLLRRLPALAALSLVDGELETADLEILATLKSLEVLALHGTELPRRAVKRLQYRLPNCRISCLDPDYVGGRVDRRWPGPGTFFFLKRIVPLGNPCVKPLLWQEPDG